MEHWMRSLFEKSYQPMAFVEVKIDQGDLWCDYVILEANTAFFDFFEFSRDHLTDSYQSFQSKGISLPELTTPMTSLFFHTAKNIHYRVDMTPVEGSIYHLALTEHSPQNYRQEMFTHAPVGIFLVSPEGRYLSVNQKATEMTGYTTDELLKMSVRDFIVPEEETRCDAHFQTVHTCGVARDVLGYYTKEGELRYWSISAFKLSDGTLLAFKEDMTQRVLLQRQIEERNHRLRALLDSLNVGIVVGDKANGDFVFANKTMLEMMGSTYDEFMTLSVRDIHPQEELDELLVLFNKSLEGESVYTNQHHLKARDGRIIPIALHTTLIDYGNETAAMAIFQDISSAEYMKKRLELATEIVEHVNIGLFVYQLENLEDDRSLRMIYANPASFDLTGVKPSEIIGKAIDECFPGLRALGIPQRYAQIILSGESDSFDDLYYGDDRVISAAFSVKVFPLPNNHVGIAFENISHRKQIEIDLQEAKAVAEEANQAKSQFLANTSHEIRTPLNAVIGFTDLMLGLPMDSLLRSHAEHIKVSGRALLGIIDDILDLSKIEAGKMELEYRAVSIAPLLEEVTTILHVQASAKGLLFVLDLPNNLPKLIRIDSVRLKQVLLNLLNNAIKFTEKGEVVLTVYWSVADDVENPTTGHLRFKVRDTGIGMTQDQQRMVFKAFSQADASTTRRFGGTGLGLKISKYFVNEMGSDIEVYSVYGEGSIFEFEIPVTIIEGESHWSLSKLMGSSTCLLITPYSTLHAAYRRFFRDTSVQLTHAESLADAYTQVGRRQFDLVIYYEDLTNAIKPRLLNQFYDHLKGKHPDCLFVLIYNPLSRLGARHLKDTQKSSIFDHALIAPTPYTALVNLFDHESGHDERSVPSVDVSHKTPDLSVTPRILIVDDVYTNVLLAKIVLMKHFPNAIVFEAFNGLDALKILMAHEVDVVFLDIQMPEMSGIEVTQKYREFERIKGKEPLKIVAISAGVLQEEEAVALESGMNGFMKKPINLDELIQWIQ